MNVHPKNCSSYHPCCCMVKTAFKYVFPPNRDDDFCLIFCIYPSSMIRKQGITSVLGGVVKIIWNPVKNDDFSIPIFVFYIYRYATKQLHTKERILSRINDEWPRNPMQRKSPLTYKQTKKRSYTSTFTDMQQSNFTPRNVLSRINDEWSRNPMQRNHLLLTNKQKGRLMALLNCR